MPQAKSIVACTCGRPVPVIDPMKIRLDHDEDCAIVAQFDEASCVSDDYGYEFQTQTFCFNYVLDVVGTTYFPWNLAHDNWPFWGLKHATNDFLREYVKMNPLATVKPVHVPSQCDGCQMVSTADSPYPIPESFYD